MFNSFFFSEKMTWPLEMSGAVGSEMGGAIGAGNTSRRWTGGIKHSWSLSESLNAVGLSLQPVPQQGHV
jgi:hypothetical protein